MTTLSSQSLWQAIYDKLVNDSTLMGQISGIYDPAPESRALPYITIGEGSIRDWVAKDVAGDEWRDLGMFFDIPVASSESVYDILVGDHVETKVKTVTSSESSATSSTDIPKGQRIRTPVVGSHSAQARRAWMQRQRNGFPLSGRLPPGRPG